MSEIEVPALLKPFQFHGVEFVDRSGQDLVADCPFCGRARHFAVNAETGQFLCGTRASRCAKKGNVSGFLAAWAARCAAETSAARWRELSENRGVSSQAYKRHGVGFDEIAGRWLIPVRNGRGIAVDLRHFRLGKATQATEGCHVGLWGEDRLAKSKKGTPCWICEGEHDGIVADWLHHLAGRDRVVLAVPGARIFKAPWTQLFRGREVTLPYDADSEGDVYSWRAGQKLKGKCTRVLYLSWPDDLPDGFDIRDRAKAGRDAGEEPDEVLASLEAAVGPEHRAPPEARPGTGSADSGAQRKRRTGRRPPWRSVIGEYRRWLKMNPDLEDAVRLSYATVLSNQLASDPVWLFLCGTPGSGKTEVLMSIKDVPDVYFQSSVGPRTLVSGFRLDGAADPSILAQMIGRVAVFKDWTEMLRSNPYALEEVYSILRGAYDGHVFKAFGNGVVREYEGLFSMLVGVTNEIHGHSYSRSGERFMKFQLPSRPSRNRETLMAAMTSIGQEGDRAKALRATACGYLDREVKWGELRDWLSQADLERISSLAELVAVLRGEVDWERRGPEKVLKVRPTTENPNRLGKQLCKLAWTLATMMEESDPAGEALRLTERVAFDTAIGFSLDVVEGIMRLGGAGVRRDDLAEACMMPPTNLDSRLEDLMLLGAVRREKRAAGGPGRPGWSWRVTGRVKRLWEAARVSETHVESAAAGRVPRRKV